MGLGWNLALPRGGDLALPRKHPLPRRGTRPRRAGAGGTGALYGAGIGAVAGLIHSLAKHHQNVVLQPGTPLAFLLTSPGQIATASQSKGTPVPFVCQSGS